MKASELISELQRMVKKHGDLDCMRQDLDNYSWCDFDVENIEVDSLGYRKEPIFRVN